MADADEATSALIARILAGDAEQDAYAAPYDDIGNGECSDDPDFGHPKKKARVGRGKASGHAPQVRAIANGAHGLPPELLEGYTETGRRRRKDSGAKRETVSKGWSEEEEVRFLEALELHGREWHKGAAHVGTRDKKQFTSHAQKHFIKLCIADKSLPDKVIQTGQGSGLGYTLSGYLLDPESASAYAYGLRPEHVKRLKRSRGPGANGLLLPNKENALKDTDDQTQRQKFNKKTETQQARGSRICETEGFKPCEPTEYAKSRPKRDGAGVRSAMGHTSESLELTVCRDFIGPPGGQSALSQPFEVTIDQQVNLVMDFHAHMCGCEIIGVLGGIWNPQERCLHVKVAYPCDRLEGSHSGTSVEVDPAAQLAAQEEMQQAGLTSVGWYHSHPIFAAIPSQKDNENQRNQQALHRCGQTGLEPCVGAIVSPYDQSLPSEASVISWFVVQNKGSQLMPYRIRISGDSHQTPLADSGIESVLLKLITSAVNDSARTDFSKEWRPYRLLVEGQASGGRLTHLQKLRLAMTHHFRGEGSDPEAISKFLDGIIQSLKQTWKIRDAKTLDKQQQGAGEDTKA